MHKHPANTHGIYTIRDLQAHYERTRPDGHWFDRGNMSFYRTRLSESLYYPTATQVLFISSESYRTADVRGYTVRVYDTTTGLVSNDGNGFMGYKTLHAAKRAASLMVDAAHIREVSRV